MAFEELKRGEWSSNKAKTARVVASTANKTSNVRFGISFDVFAKLGNPPFVKVLLDNSIGMILVKPSMTRMENCFRVNKKGPRDAATFTLSLGKLNLRGAKFKTTELGYEVTEQGLMIDISNLKGA